MEGILDQIGGIMGKKNDLGNNPRKIVLAGDINTQTLIEIEKSLDSIFSSGQKKVVLQISSPGGGLDVSMGIYDIFRTCGFDIDTKVYGHASSMAVILMLLGNKRQISSNSRIFLHEMGTTFDKPTRYSLSQVKSLYKELAGSQQMYVDIIYERIGKTLSKSKILAMMQSETILTPDEAVKYGFVNEII